jgi:alpha-D-ribose 1-methylphosphonate 5-triphosphate synthase subunit PhnG
MRGDRLALVRAAEVVFAIGRAQHGTEHAQVLGHALADAHIGRAGQDQRPSARVFIAQELHKVLAPGQAGRVGLHGIGQGALEPGFAARQPGQHAQQVQRILAHEQHGRLMQRVARCERTVQIHVERAVVSGVVVQHAGGVKGGRAILGGPRGTSPQPVSQCHPRWVRSITTCPNATV